MSEVNVGIIFKSYEPMSAIQAYAAQSEASGYFGGFWIAEAYHWFRSYGLEARGCFTALAAATMATKEIPIGLGITSPYMRHPTILASEAAGIDELSNGRFIMGIGVGKVGIEYLEYDIDVMKPVHVHQESLDIMRKIWSGEQYEYKGNFYESSMPAYDRVADGLRTDIPVYVGATGPFMQRLAGRSSNGMLLAGLTSPNLSNTPSIICAKVQRRQGETFPKTSPLAASYWQPAARMEPKPRSSPAATPAPISLTSCATLKMT